jgi:hypothetical protein
VLDLVEPVGAGWDNLASSRQAKFEFGHGPDIDLPASNYESRKRPQAELTTQGPQKAMARSKLGSSTAPHRPSKVKEKVPRLLPHRCDAVPQVEMWLT